MRNQITDLRLHRIGNMMRIIRENQTRFEQDLKTLGIKRMQHRLRSSMHLIEDRYLCLRSITRVMVGIPYKFGLVEETIPAEIIHNIRVVDHISTVIRRRIWWEMLDIVLLGFMQHWITGKQITGHMLSTWMVSFVNKLFLF